ncbi:hypothetical protein N8009_00430 [Flavobacteriaceae bacterium]|nr:hypothetical protein [Flavobacteriaceae bacterium]
MKTKEAKNRENYWKSGVGKEKFIILRFNEGSSACLPSGRVELVDLPIGRQARLTARKHTKK